MNYLSIIVSYYLKVLYEWIFMLKLNGLMVDYASHRYCYNLAIRRMDIQGIIGAANTNSVFPESVNYPFIIQLTVSQNRQQSLT